jgi:hypothetical protein
VPHLSGLVFERCGFRVTFMLDVYSGGPGVNLETTSGALPSGF